MKFAVIADIHANLPALEKVLGHIKREEVRDIWNLGDFVGYGAFPNEVIKSIRDRGAISIAGNYDTKTLNIRKKSKKWQRNKMPEKLLAFRWAYENLSKENRKYLRKLPLELTLEIAENRFLLTHGSPESSEDHLTSTTTDERLQEIAQYTHVDVILCGHSHQPFARHVHNTWFINPGSVGRPDDGDPRASYAIINFKSGKFDIVHYRLEYDIERAAAGIRQRGLPESFAQMIIQGYDLNTINKNMSVE
jgi:putative phosphoesterase